MKKQTFVMWVVFVLSFTMIGCGGGGGSSNNGPTNLTVTIGDNAGELTISWTAVDGATSYNLYRGTTSGVTKATGTKIETVTSPYTDDGLTDGTRYYYVATAITAAGESSDSSEANGLPQINPVGTIDTTGIPPNGYVRYTANVPTGGTSSGVAIDSSGKIIMTGDFQPDPDSNSDTYMALWRYNTDGTLDTNFGGGNGYVMTHETVSGLTSEYGRDIAIDSTGKIIVVGYGENALGKSQMIIWRFDSTGTADATFGSGGYVTYNRGFDENYGYGIALDSTGKILVAGSSKSATDLDMTLWRYTDAGVLDTAFGGTGVVFHHNAAGGNAADNGNDLVVDSSDGIAVVGDSANATDADLVIWRFTSAGELNTAFGGDGIVLYDGGDQDSGNDVTLDSQNRILAVGISANAGEQDIVILRYTNTGDLDTAFSDDGIVIYSSGEGDSGDSIKIDSRQRVVVSGSIGTLALSASNMAILRLNSNGSFDATFDSDGVVLFKFSDNSQDHGNAIAFDTTGRIVIAGGIELPPAGPLYYYYPTLWRYN